MSKETDHSKIFIQVFNAIVGVAISAIMVFGLVMLQLANPDWMNPSPVIKSETAQLPIDLEGFLAGEGREIVALNCTRCHSAKLVTQNRATREGWESMIRWMQETQNLWPLGDNEKIILDYLAKYYGPEKKGRRQNLAKIEWYELED